MRAPRPSPGPAATLAVWLAAAAVYVVIGVFAVDFLLSFWVAAGYLLATTWLLPAAVRRWL